MRALFEYTSLAAAILTVIVFTATSCSDKETTNTVNSVDIEVCGHEHECQCYSDSVWIGPDTITITDTLVEYLACEHPNCHRKHCDD